MISKVCRETRRQIDELGLDERPSEGATRHLAECGSCREFRAERIELRDVMSGLEPVVAPADFDMRLRARIAAERATSREQPFFANLFRTPALVAASLFVVVAGSLVWVAQRNVEQSLPVASSEDTARQSTNIQTGSEKVPAATIDTSESPASSDQVVQNVSGFSDRKSRSGARGSRVQDFDVKPAESIRQGDQAFVNAPSKPVVFTVEDERGTKRKISLPPVSFGSQSLVDNRVPVSYVGNSRVW